MKIIVKKVGLEPEVREVPNELHVLQEIVGGYIECIPFVDDTLCICNETGKLDGLLPNFIYNNDVIVGDVFFCSSDRCDFNSLTDEQIMTITNLLHIFEI